MFKVVNLIFILIMLIKFVLLTVQQEPLHLIMEAVSLVALLHFMQKIQALSQENAYNNVLEVDSEMLSREHV